MIKADALLGRVTMNTNGGIGIGQLLFSCYTRIKDFLYNFAQPSKETQSKDQLVFGNESMYVCI